MSAIDNRVKSIKGRLAFGEVAAELGLSGASRKGWDCPACSAHHTLKERADNQGARCGVCAEGFDIVSVVMRARGESFLSALLHLERQADKKEAAAATGAGDLFGGGQ